MVTLNRITLVSLMTAIALTLLAGCQDAPSEITDKAAATVKDASEKGALKYAPVLYRESQRLLNDGRIEVARQNGRLAPMRNYATADSLLRLAAQTARRAIDSTRVRRDRLRKAAVDQQARLRTDLSTWRQALDGSLVLYDAERRWKAAELALAISQKLIDSGEYRAALKGIETARDSLDRVGDILAHYADDESQQRETWDSWVRETLDNSRRKSAVAIIVDKSAHQVFLVKGGKLIKAFDGELGHNSARQKLFAGDGATPEGKYRVTMVKRTGSKYYKALLLDYPNARDRKRFAENERTGVIARGAGIGGLIEIHGDGGRNEDWTDGCIALKNDEMDELMKYVSVGTPVTIVRKTEIWP